MNNEDEASSENQPPVSLFSSTTSAMASRTNLSGNNFAGPVTPTSFRSNASTPIHQSSSRAKQVPPQPPIPNTTPVRSTNNTNPSKSTGLFQYKSPSAVISTSIRSTPYAQPNRFKPPVSLSVSSDLVEVASNEEDACGSQYLQGVDTDAFFDDF